MAISQKKYEEEQAAHWPDYDILLPDPPVSNQYPLLVVAHGRNGNKHSHMEYWEIARQKGWLVLLAQSHTTAYFEFLLLGINPTQGLEDLLSYYKQVSQKYQIDPQQVVIAGFSQGGGMTIYAALSGKINVRGFIGVTSFYNDPNSLKLLTNDPQSVRGYFITGEKDHTLENVRAIQQVLKKNNIQFTEEVHSDLGHEFPPDFEKSFDKAIDFIFKEQE